MMKTIISRIILASIFSSCTAHAAAYDGWIRLSMREVQEQNWRKVSPTKFLSVRLDMDGDGKKDVAAIVVRRDLKKSAICVCFGETARRQQCQIVAVSENVADVMGLEHKNSGCYTYIEDDAGRPSRGKKICVRNDMLEYFKFGSASSIFLYEAKRDTFGRYWDSD